VSAPVEALLAAAIATDSTTLGVEPGAQLSQTTLDGALWCKLICEAT